MENTFQGTTLSHDFLTKQTFQDDRLQLTLFSIPSHHELYELGDMYIRNVDWNVDFLVSDDALDTFEV